jgi:hypothetical protein
LPLLTFWPKATRTLKKIFNQFYEDPWPLKLQKKPSAIEQMTTRIDSTLQAFVMSCTRCKAKLTAVKQVKKKVEPVT